MALSRQSWPVDPGGKDAFYGRPSGANDAAWRAQNLVSYAVPWTGHTVMVHSKVRASLDRVLTQYWNEIGHDQSVISKYGLADVETYNYRANRNNPASLSNHSYGIAVDIAPAKNPNGSHWVDGGTMLPRRLIELFKFEGWRAGLDFGGTKDPMHFEAVHDQHHDQPPVPAPASVTATTTVPTITPTPTVLPPAIAPSLSPLLALGEEAAALVIRQLLSNDPAAAQKAADLRAKLNLVRDVASASLALLDKVAPVGSPLAAPPALGGPSFPTWLLPQPQPAPAPAATVSANVQTGIIATWEGGDTDRESDAYDGHLIRADEPGCSLPFHFPSPRPLISIRGPNGLVATVPLVDVGPIYPSPRGPADPYWLTNSRPRAETKGILTRAGIDLTKKTFTDVGGNLNAGKVKVDWWIAGETPSPPQPSTGATQVSTQSDAFLSWLAARLKEPSTYSGIAAIGALVAGHALDPGLIQEITTWGGVAAGALGVFLSEGAKA